MIHYSKRHLKEKGIFLTKLWWVVFQNLWLVHFDPCRFTQWFSPSMVRCRTAFLLLCFFDRGHPRFWNFYSTIPVDVVRVKSYVNYLFDSARVAIRVTINKLYFVPEWLMSGVVGMLWNGGGLGTGESDASIVLLNSVLHGSSSLFNAHLAPFTRNPVNYAILFSRVDSVLWWY